MIDCYATEPHFVDHLAPVWHALPEKGRFITDPGLVPRAKALGIPAIAMRPPRYDPQPVSDERPILVASFGDTKKAGRMGRTRIAFLEHGIGQSYAGDPKSAAHGSYAGGDGRGQTSLFMVPNEHSATRWRSAYPGARVEVVGSPRLDSLPVRQAESEPVVCVSFHFDCRISPEARSSFPYYVSALEGLAKRYRVIGHGHPRAIRTFAAKYRRLRIEVVEDFADVCARADIYVADNTSTLYEFASTGRPVVVLNAPIYRRGIQHGLRFWDAANVGINVEQPAQLAEAVAEGLVDVPKRKWDREHALGIVYAYRTGAAERAAERAAGVLADWAAELTEVAA